MIKISLNAGHLVGVDPGAVSGGYQEAVLVNTVQDACSRVLRRDYLLELEDTDKLYTDDVTEANQLGVDYAIEFHLNSSTNPAAHGFETFVYTGHAGSLTLQRNLHSRLFAIMQKYGVTGRDRGAKQATQYWYLRGTKMPSIIVEFCFVSNPQEVAAFAKSAEKIGEDCAHAIAAAVSLPKKAVGYTRDYPETGQFKITTGRPRYLCSEPSLTSRELGTVSNTVWIGYNRVVYNDGRIWVFIPSKKGWVSVGSYDRKTEQRIEAFATFK